jgi:hypothetical protein
MKTALRTCPLCETACGLRLSLEAMRQAPHGLDLGPLQPRLPEILCTASGKVELAPAALAADVPRLLEREPAARLGPRGQRAGGGA